MRVPGVATCMAADGDVEVNPGPWSEGKKRPRPTLSIPADLLKDSGKSQPHRPQVPDHSASSSHAGATDGSTQSAPAPPLPALQPTTCLEVARLIYGGAQRTMISPKQFKRLGEGGRQTLARILHTRAPATNAKADQTARQFLEFCLANPQLGHIAWSEADQTLSAFITVRLRDPHDPPQVDGWIRPRSWRRIQPHSFDSQLSTFHAAIERAGWPVPRYRDAIGPRAVATALGTTDRHKSTPKTPLFAWQAIEKWREINKTNAFTFPPTVKKWWAATVAGLYFCLRPEMIGQLRYSWFTIRKGGLLLAYAGTEKPHRRRAAPTAGGKAPSMNDLEPRESAARCTLVTEVLIPVLQEKPAETDYVFPQWDPTRFAKWLRETFGDDSLTPHSLRTGATEEHVQMRINGEKINDGLRDILEMRASPKIVEGSAATYAHPLLEDLFLVSESMGKLKLQKVSKRIVDTVE